MNTEKRDGKGQQIEVYWRIYRASTFLRSSMHMKNLFRRLIWAKQYNMALWRASSARAEPPAPRAQLGQAKPS